MLTKNLMKKILLPISLIILSTLTACSSLETIKSNTNISVQHQQTIQHNFDQAQLQGVIVTKQAGHIQVYGNSLARANTAYIPASTFKMLNALIGLEHHKASVDEVFRWDGQKRAYASWQKDMTLGEAMQLSAVPVYQTLARRIGLDLMQKEVKRINFGNHQIGTQVDNFWLVGPLKITPIQEVEFVDQLAQGTLPFSQNVQQQVRQMLLLQEINGNKVYGKTGWGMDVTPQVGWLTGWVEQPNGHKVAYSLNVEMKADTPPKIRQDLVISSLKNLGII